MIVNFPHVWCECSVCPVMVVVMVVQCQLRSAFAYCPHTNDSVEIKIANGWIDNYSVSSLSVTFVMIIKPLINVKFSHLCGWGNTVGDIYIRIWLACKPLPMFAKSVVITSIKNHCKQFLSLFFLGSCMLNLHQTAKPWWCRQSEKLLINRMLR